MKNDDEQGKSPLGTMKFLSGEEALAKGVRLVRPAVVATHAAISQGAATYATASQRATTEHLSKLADAAVPNGDFTLAESAPAALSAALEAVSHGSRAFVVSFDQGLLDMAELLGAAGCNGYPLVMGNLNRSTSSRANNLADQRGSLSLLDHGWIQAYAKDAQEALDLALMAYRIAEDPQVQMPFMVNLEDPALSRICEKVTVPTQEQADAFLPPYQVLEKSNYTDPMEVGFDADPYSGDLLVFNEHLRTMNVFDVLPQVEDDFARIFGRRYTGALECYENEDAEYVIVALGTLFGLACDVVDELRASGIKAGCIRLRYLRPFPDEQLVAALEGKKCAAVIERDISFGFEGTVYTDLNSALYAASEHEGKRGLLPKTFSYIGGLDGYGITAADLHSVFAEMKDGKDPASHAFLGLRM